MKRKISILLVVLLMLSVLPGCLENKFPAPIFDDDELSVFNYYYNGEFVEVDRERFVINKYFSQYDGYYIIPSFDSLERRWHTEATELRRLFIVYVTAMDYYSWFDDTDGEGKYWTIPMKINKVYYTSDGLELQTDEIITIKGSDFYMTLNDDVLGLNGESVYFRRGHHYIIYGSYYSNEDKYTVYDKFGIIELKPYEEIQNFYRKNFDNTAPHSESYRDEILNKYWYK